MRSITELIQQAIPLADKNWFGTGGQAEFYAEPHTPEEFSSAILYARTHNLPITMLGEGANVLISDAGISGLVIRPAIRAITLRQTQDLHQQVSDSSSFITAQAGTRLHDLIEWCLAHGALGLEEFSGIPGTVGGSVFINIHYFDFLLSNFIESAHIIHAHTGEITHVDNAWFNFSYNYSTLHKHEYYLIDATFKLKHAATPLEIAYAQGRRAEIIRHRVARYPNSGTCGSFFRNFFPDEVTLESLGKKLIYVAYYLDKVGVKGALSYGDAIVSYKHANMLVNRGKASSHDLITLARAMQQKVYDLYGIIPQPECKLLGFSEYPLL